MPGNGRGGGPPGMKKENSRRSFDIVMQSVEGLFVCLYLSSYTHKLGVNQLNDSLHDIKRVAQAFLDRFCTSRSYYWRSS